VTQVTVPSAGDPIITSWGQAVANHANHMIPLYMSADATTTSTLFGTITDLTFSVTNGKEYTIPLTLFYTVGGTNTGLDIGYALSGGATGTCRFYVKYAGNASATGVTNDWVDTEDTATGPTSTDSTAMRIIWADGIYRCTADGTFSMRFARNGTSTTVTIYAGSGGVVVEN
jgi:hypothetical protein